MLIEDFVHADSQTPELMDLVKELYQNVANKWKTIGILLGIEKGSLDKIKTDNAGNSGDCLQEMLDTWLKKVDPKPSWSAMTDVLKRLGEESLAEHIRKRYCNTC